MQLKELRQKAGLSVRDLADIVGCEKTLIYRLENGERRFTEEKLHKLADYFGVTTDELLGRER